jgi:hypothetical protein
MTAGGSDLQRTLRERLPGDVGEVGTVRWPFGLRRRIRSRQGGASAGEPVHDLAEVVRHPDVDVRHQRGLRAVARRHDHAADTGVL